MKNKDIKCKYLMIDAKNVVNYPNDLFDRKFISYDKCDKPFIDLNEIFENNDIPLKYRVFIVKMNSFVSRFGCQEYLTEIPFDYTGYIKNRKNDNSKIIKGRTITNNSNNIIEFETPMDFKTYNEIMLFLVDLTNDGLFDKYIMALAQIFNIYYSYDNVEILTKYRRMRKNRDNGRI